MIQAVTNVLTKLCDTGCNQCANQAVSHVKVEQRLGDGGRGTEEAEGEWEAFASTVST